MKDLSIKNLKLVFGVPFIAIVVCAAIFMAPGFLYDTYKYYDNCLRDK